ncbi:MAG: CopG family transcriptional regulator [gamma proteobacterium symbiont of Clathrolucina costata]
MNNTQKTTPARKPVTVTLPLPLLGQVDQLAHEADWSRTDIIRRALEVYLQHKDKFIIEIKENTDVRPQQSTVRTD